ncbi:MAG: hypothetical protein ACP5SH_17245 [Syntrophobacteraceae bacterium]
MECSQKEHVAGVSRAALIVLAVGLCVLVTTSLPAAFVAVLHTGTFMGAVEFGLSTVVLAVCGFVLIFGGELNAPIRTVLFILLFAAFVVAANTEFHTFFCCS